MRRPASWSALLLLASACAPAPGTTYHRDVRPILEQRCEGCHDAQGIGGFDLTGYDNARTNAARMVPVVVDRTMPPWLAAGDVRYLNDRRLTDAEIETIRAWAEGGAPAGDPADYVKRPVARPLRVDAELPMHGAYLPNQATDDDYRCFLVDPALTASRALTGFDLRPTSPQILHHVSFSAVGPALAAQMAEADALDATEGFPCDGFPPSQQQFLGFWTPGTGATTYTDGLGLTMPPGTRLLLEIHFDTTRGKGLEERTTALLEWSDLESVEPALVATSVHSLDIDVPPGEVGSVTGTFALADFELAGTEPLVIHGAGPHLHQRGQSVRVWLERGGQTIPLLDVPKWNYHRQQLFLLAEPVTFGPDDRVSIECRFDNRAESQPMVNGVRLEPGRLRWGGNAADEMCQLFLFGTR